MNWVYVVVVYRSDHKPRGYLRAGVVFDQWAMVPEFRLADTFSSESAAMNARDHYTPEPGCYTAVEQRRV